MITVLPSCQSKKKTLFKAEFCRFNHKNESDFTQFSPKIPKIGINKCNKCTVSASFVSRRFDDLYENSLDSVCIQETLDNPGELA